MFNESPDPYFHSIQILQNLASHMRVFRFHGDQNSFHLKSDVHTAAKITILAQKQWEHRLDVRLLLLLLQKN